MKSLRLVDADTTPQPRPMPSPAREKLRALLDRRAQADTRIKNLQLATGRLNETFERVAKATAALDAFEAKSAAAMLEWAILKKDPPVVDSEAKLKLLSEHAAAKDQAHAATSAREQITVSIQQEAAASQALEPAILEAIVEIIIESTVPLLEDLKAAKAAVAAKQGRLNQAVQEAVNVARSMSPDPVGSTRVLIANLIEQFRSAASPAIETTAADVEVWRSFSARLRRDPAAGLEG